MSGGDRGRCRSCGTVLDTSFIDLGDLPLANDFLPGTPGVEAERFPLHVWVCDGCLLAQLWPDVPPDRLFRSYTYLSSYSSSWLEHARRFTRAAIERCDLDGGSRVVEIASNDGYLLRNFNDAGIPCLGIEPAENVAELARRAGVDTRAEFFGSELAAELVDDGWVADLVILNNVLAHVPDLSDVVAGLAVLVAPDGLVSVEFPTVSSLLEGSQFDTIYHEHYSYLCLTSCRAVLARHGLRVVDVEELPTHGGSLRVWAARDGSSHGVDGSVHRMLEAESARGLDGVSGYQGAAARMRERAAAIRAFVIDEASAGALVAGYGAAAKTTIVANVCGLTDRDIRYVVDLNPLKCGSDVPGTSIPVSDVERLRLEPPDVLVVFPWNLADEIVDQVAGVVPPTCRIVTTMPGVAELPRAVAPS